MINNVSHAGRQRLAKATIKIVRASMRLRTERNVRVNQALLAEREVRRDDGGAQPPAVVEVTPPAWTGRIRDKYPEHYRN